MAHQPRGRAVREVARPEGRALSMPERTRVIQSLGTLMQEAGNETVSGFMDRVRFTVRAVRKEDRERVEEEEHRTGFDMGVEAMERILLFKGLSVRRRREEPDHEDVVLGWRTGLIVKRHFIMQFKGFSLKYNSLHLTNNVSSGCRCGVVPM